MGAEDETGLGPRGSDGGHDGPRRDPEPGALIEDLPDAVGVRIGAVQCAASVGDYVRGLSLRAETADEFLDLPAGDRILLGFRWEVLRPDEVDLGGAEDAIDEQVPRSGLRLVAAQDEERSEAEAVGGRRRQTDVVALRAADGDHGCGPARDGIRQGELELA